VYRQHRPFPQAYIKPSMHPIVTRIGRSYSVVCEMITDEIEVAHLKTLTRDGVMKFYQVSAACVTFCKVNVS